MKFSIKILINDVEEHKKIKKQYMDSLKKNIFFKYSEDEKKLLYNKYIESIEKLEKKYNIYYKNNLLKNSLFHNK